MEKHSLNAGTAVAEISPSTPQSLAGYPFVARVSTGVHDPLLATALVLECGETTMVFCSLDLLYVTKKQSAAIREAVTAQTGIPAANVMISATHTHSGPVVSYSLISKNDPTISKPDPEYISFLIEQTTAVIVRAYESRVPAEMALTTADATGVGCNRRAPEGASDPEVPVLVLRDPVSAALKAVLMVYCMHPTVLHEDSTLCSADFPGAARQRMQQVLGADVPVVYHTGPEGNQSPRHCVSGNTFEEAERLGNLLAEQVLGAIRTLSEEDYISETTLQVASAECTLSRRTFPSVDVADEKRCVVEARLNAMRQNKDDPREIRTAECDWFGACELVALSEALESGDLDKSLADVLPVELQVFRVGSCCFVSFPGELFVEYSLMIKERAPIKSYVLCLCNGGLHGYIVTPEALAEGGYEACNSIFPPEAGMVLVEQALVLLNGVS